MRLYQIPLVKPPTLPKSLIFVSATIGLSASLYYLYKKASDALVTETPDLEFRTLEPEFSKLQRLALRDKNQSFLGEDTMEAILDMSVAICKERYARLVKSGREERRKLFDGSRKDYERCVIENLGKVEEAVFDGIQKALRAAGIELNKYEESVEKLAEGSSELNEMAGRAMEKLRNSLVGSEYRCLREEEVVKILENWAEELPKYKPHTNAYRSILKNAVAADVIFEKYGVEEEQVDMAEERKPTDETRAARKILNEVKLQEADQFRCSPESILISKKRIVGVRREDLGASSEF